MLNFSNINQEFFKYVEQFDLKDERIQRKKFHSIRVQEISKQIAEDLKLNEEYIDIASLIGLLHDIGRFEQEKQYHTFDDDKSFDHGDYGADLLKKSIRNYINVDKYDNIIIQAIKNHNKLQINPNLKDNELLFSKIIRDADKLDIMYETINIFYIGKEKIINNLTLSDYSYNSIKKNKPVFNSYSIDINYLDKIVRCIAFIFDLNYKKSFEIIKENNYISKIIKKYYYKDKATQIRMNEIEEIANKYVDEKLRGY